MLYLAIIRVSSVYAIALAFYFLNLLNANLYRDTQKTLQSDKLELIVQFETSFYNY